MSSLKQISDFMAEAFPQSKAIIDAVDAASATVRHAITAAELRPGGTVAGPVLMAVTDAALCVAIAGSDIVGVCRLMKAGRSPAVGEVWLYSAGTDQPVAHAVGTYALPPSQSS